jgi:GTP:adenosylcobinamide-phosphate guanylyltransferase
LDKLFGLNVIIGIQARMSSKRLPGKVLADIAGKPMIQRVWEACEGPWRRIILTSFNESDDPLVEFCQANGMEYRLGLLDDVIHRYWSLATTVWPNILIRVCGDAPFMRAKWIKLAIERSVNSETAGGPVFVPQLMHLGHPFAWDQAYKETPVGEAEHAGYSWFEKNGIHLELAPPDYLMVNTQEDLEEARRRFAAVCG